MQAMGRCRWSIWLLVAPTCHTYPTLFDSVPFERNVYAPALQQAPEGSSHVIFDVGANDSSWSLKLAKRLNVSKLIAARRLRVSMFLLEPQPNFHRRLQSVTELLNSMGVDAHYLPYAASKRNSTQQMSLQTGRRADTTVARLTDGKSAAANFSGQLNLVSVPTIDLASFVLDRLPAQGSGSLSFLKLDTESYEYKLLPRLITRDVLWYAWTSPMFSLGLLRSLCFANDHARLLPLFSLDG